MHAKPNPRTVAEQLAEAGGNIRRNRLAAGQNCMKVLPGDAEQFGKLAFRPVEVHNDVVDHLTGCGGLRLGSIIAAHSVMPNLLMILFEINAVCVAIFNSKVMHHGPLT